MFGRNLRRLAELERKRARRRDSAANVPRLLLSRGIGESDGRNKKYELDAVGSCLYRLRIALDPILRLQRFGLLIDGVIPLLPIRVRLEAAAGWGDGASGRQSDTRICHPALSQRIRE
jgi:hypothetical protein